MKSHNINITVEGLVLLLVISVILAFNRTFKFRFNVSVLSNLQLDANHCLNIALEVISVTGKPIINVSKESR